MHLKMLSAKFTAILSRGRWVNLSNASLVYSSTLYLRIFKTTVVLTEGVDMFFFGLSSFSQWPLFGTWSHHALSPTKCWKSKCQLLTCWIVLKILKIYQHFESYLGFGFTQVDEINSWTTIHIAQLILPVLHSQHHACWCTGDFSRQCISRRGIDPQIWNILFLASEGLISQHWLDRYHKCIATWLWKVCLLIISLEEHSHRKPHLKIISCN